MQFNSLTFLVFFVLVVAIHYSVRSWRLRKLNLLLASYFFYAAWNPFYVVLLWISTLTDWLLARMMGKEENPNRKRLLLGLSLAVNLGMLGYFKYGDFLLDNFLRITETLGLSYQTPELDIVLPVGISFYTFQSLSYTLDVYRGKLRPTFPLLDFSLFVAFFPQLVAGPIVRAAQFLPQCREPKKFSANLAGWGASLIIFGLFAKVALADGVLAPIVDTLFDNAQRIGSFEAWIAVFAFSGQIFFDFSGYSTCAIGAAMCLGFVLPDNFRAPYAAIGFSDFWRRWHISLSTWLRDYLYISLGGNRAAAWRTTQNLMITMLLGGLWHGASWLFVVWGSLHGLYLIVERLLARAFRGRRLHRFALVRFGLGLATFVLVSTTWVFFRSSDTQTALAMLSAMFSTRESTTTFVADRLPWFALVMTGLVAWHWVTRHSSLEAVVGRLPWWGRGCLLSIGILGIIFSSGGDERAFIYFQF